MDFKSIEAIIKLFLDTLGKYEIVVNTSSCAHMTFSLREKPKD